MRRRDDAGDTGMASDNERGDTMYGTIARLRIKPGMEEAFRSESRRQEERQIPGGIASYVYRMDRDPREIFLVVLFESKETYVANAQDPRQHEDYVRLMSFLDADPEWNDGEIISVQDTRLAR
jgi:heme-degrading monooxygenase HmoA